MKKKYFILLLLISFLIGIFPFKWYLNFPRSYEWYQIVGIEMIILTIYFIYILILIVLAFSIRLRNREKGKRLFMVIKFSTLILIGLNIIGLGIIKSRESTEHYENNFEIQGDYTKMLDSIIKVDSNNFTAYYSRAMLYKSKGDYTKSLQDLECAFKLDTNSYDIAIELGNIYKIMGMKELQDSFFYKAYKIDSVAFKRNEPSYLFKNHP